MNKSVLVSLVTKFDNRGQGELGDMTQSALIAELSKFIDTKVNSGEDKESVELQQARLSIETLRGQVDRFQKEVTELRAKAGDTTTNDVLAKLEAKVKELEDTESQELSDYRQKWEEADKFIKLMGKQTEFEAQEGTDTTDIETGAPKTKPKQTIVATTPTTHLQAFLKRMGIRAESRLWNDIEVRQNGSRFGVMFPYKFYNEVDGDGEFVNRDRCYNFLRNLARHAVERRGFDIEWKSGALVVIAHGSGSSPKS